MKLDVTVSSVMKDGGELIVSIRGWADSDPGETTARYLGEIRVPASVRSSKSYHIGRRLIIDVRPA